VSAIALVPVLAALHAFGEGHFGQQPVLQTVAFAIQKCFSKDQERMGTAQLLV
jgi:hypothetical protein